MRPETNVLGKWTQKWIVKVLEKVQKFDHREGVVPVLHQSSTSCHQSIQTCSEERSPAGEWSRYVGKMSEELLQVRRKRKEKARLWPFKRFPPLFF